MLNSVAEWTGAGSQFDVRSFHDAVLSCGMVPMSTLELIVQRYIDSQRQEHGCSV